MTFSQIILVNWAIISSLMFVMWLVSLLRKDASIVDPFWGFGFVVIAWVTFSLIDTVDERTWLLLAMTTVWGLRLTIYLTWRSIAKGTEDRRYQAMRAKHGVNFWWISLLTVFGLQGLIMWFVALVVQAGMYQSQDGELFWLDGFGFLIWLAGILFESIADIQMARFKRDSANQNAVMNRGLWRLSRHPNYFGDFCVWWGLYLVACAAGAWWTILSPLVMSFLLLKVSGVTLLESDIQQRRPDYVLYQKQTNAFFPGPSRQGRL